MKCSEDILLMVENLEKTVLPLLTHGYKRDKIVSNIPVER